MNTPIKNLIFDLGNVLYDIDFKKMNAGFTSLGIKDIETHFTLNQSHQLFLDLEMGFINEQAFFDGFRKLSNLPVTNDQITIAWNSLLVGFRKSSIQWVKENNKTYPTFLYSNTNQIHCDHFIPEFEREVADYPFESLFQTPYYSHKMGMRKPDPVSFTYILEKEGLVAGETLFVDDNEPNILAAASVGLKVLHLKPCMMLENEIQAYL
ncbi:MAG: HAD family phosphatase [Chitinophagia bacterium]|jgi:FMN phosphatase YigB (HAD superfamily)|nr:HAD family phosphatase [Chitinophagia bacterium]